MGPDFRLRSFYFGKCLSFSIATPGLLFFAIVLLGGCARSTYGRETVFQNAPINALMAGCYDGTVTVGALKERGDFGLGTLDALDGEMVALDGAYYQIKPDGRAYLLTDAARSPFASVTFFDPDQTFYESGDISFGGLKQLLDDKLRSPNLFYAIKIEGNFRSLKVRSAAPQKKPYPILTEAINEQKIFELKNQQGTLVGFRFPDYMGGTGVPGYHFHFLSKDGSVGGHVLDLLVRDPWVETDETREFFMDLPVNDAFLNFHFKEDPEAALAKVEQ
ncbi:MAG: acetolactate decarboxylase [Candidatus Omnitrophica bacterium]|nr:acetolactate decarboxylase [Candidatus Omnitrophota bacterium]